MTKVDTMIRDQIVAELQRLRAENEALRAKTGSKTDGGLKITEKGALSFYHGSRFPVTLYVSQWEKLLGQVEHIRQFIEANRDKLAVKPTKAAALQDNVA